MGVWSIVTTRKDINKLKRLFEKEIKAKNAGDLLYNLLGDDVFFDEIEDIKGKDPNEDIRYTALTRLKEIFDAGEKTFFVQFEKDVFEDMVSFIEESLSNFNKDKKEEVKFLGF